MHLWLITAMGAPAHAAPSLDDIARTALTVQDDPFDPASRDGYFNSNRRDCSNFVNDTLDRAGFGYTNLNSKGRWETASGEDRAVVVKQGANSVTPCPDPGQIAYWIDTTYVGQGISHVGIVAEVDRANRGCRVTVVDHRGASHGRTGVRSFSMDLANPDAQTVDGESVNHILRYSDRTLASQLLYGFTTPQVLAEGSKPALVADASEPDAEPATTSSGDTSGPRKGGRRARARLAESLAVGHASMFHENPGMRALDPTELRLLRNLLFAKNGLPFTDRVLRCVYGQQDWYQPHPQQTPDLALQGFDRLDNALLNRILREERSRKKTKKPAANRLGTLVACEDAQDSVDDAIKGKGRALRARVSPQLMASLLPTERDEVMRHLVDGIERHDGKPQKTGVLLANLFDLVRHEPSPAPASAPE